MQALRLGRAPLIEGSMSGDDPQARARHDRYGLKHVITGPDSRLQNHAKSDEGCSRKTYRSDRVCLHFPLSGAAE